MAKRPVFSPITIPPYFTEVETEFVFFPGTSGKLKCFLYGNRKFELSPTTFFYNWLYVNALSLHPELSSEMIKYDAFTDIEFNPERSINCQARSAALFVSLYRNGLLDIALRDKESFLSTVYGNTISTANDAKQLALWD